MNATACPQCVRLRHELDQALEEARQLRDAACAVDSVEALRRRFRLTPTQGRILEFMLRRDTATKHALNEALYGDRADGGPDEHSVGTIVCYLRGKLRPHGIEIATVWGSGWRMDAENKAKVRAAAGLAV